MALLEVKNIKKKFGSTEVLKDINFDLEEGQAISIIGSSGSGKTTLLRCLNFLEIADGGTITVRGRQLFDGSDIRTRSDKEIRANRTHFGMVFQQFNLFPQYTAFENVTLAPIIHAKENGQSIDSIKEHGREILKQMGLEDRMDNYPHQLSGGQQQRVAIARALANDPKVLLKVLRGLADKKTTMIIVTHEMAFARDVADKIIFMDGGRIIEQGDPKQVIDNPKEERTKQFLSNYAKNK